MKIAWIIPLLALLGGCASKPSTSVGLAEIEEVSLTSVLKSIDQYESVTVRWGGLVTETENKADHTLVFVVARALKNNEKPLSNSASEGRFVARFDRFIDPLVYQEGRPLVVLGEIEGSLQRPIGEYDYRFPIVTVRDSYLWADPSKQPKVYYYPDPWLYHSFHYHHIPHHHKHKNKNKN